MNTRITELEEQLSIAKQKCRETEQEVSLNQWLCLDFLEVVCFFFSGLIW